MGLLQWCPDWIKKNLQKQRFRTAYGGAAKIDERRDQRTEAVNFVSPTNMTRFAGRPRKVQDGFGQRFLIGDSRLDRARCLNSPRQVCDRR
jgi:hypothetical protein